MFDVHQFLFRSDWTLAASGGAYMKLHVNITANRRNSKASTSRGSGFQPRKENALNSQLFKKEVKK
jgi:hypothetical protein